MLRLRLDPFSPSGVSVVEPPAQPRQTIIQRGAVAGQAAASSSTPGTSTDSRFTDFEGAMRTSDEIDLFTFPLIMRDSAGGDWALSVSTLGSLFTSPVMQDETNARILDESGDIIVLE